MGEKSYVVAKDQRMVTRKLRPESHQRGRVEAAHAGQHLQSKLGQTGSRQNLMCTCTQF